ncbi:MAG: tetratricopeptide repeat protein, partial [Gemmataceae bacterium]|nr:tetratricopeptide repeat protein [Gemmataceae bacterium]
PSIAELAEALCGPSPSLALPSVPPPSLTPATVLHAPPADLAQRFLELARKWGHARAVQKLRGRAHGAGNERESARHAAFLDWIASPHGATGPEADLSGIAEAAALRGWALVGQASRQLRERQYRDALRLLENVENGDDPMLEAAVAHTRGAALVHLGRCDEALPHLGRALDLLGRSHFMTGRVLDTLGTAYSTKGNFPIAREFYEQSLRFKRGFDDDSGVALSHGQLGRLFLEWGHLDEAEEHFQADLELAQKLRSRYSEAQIYNHLGQVALARGEAEAQAGRRPAMRRHFATAAGWLLQSVELAQATRHPINEGYARKDKARLHLLEGDAERAADEARQAHRLFSSSGFAEGTAKTALVEAMILRQQEKWSEAESKLRGALEHFETAREEDDAVQAWWERARIERDRGAPSALVSRCYAQALARAEGLRHDPLVRGIEREFHDVDPEGFLRHIYQRARGWSIDADDPSLMEGTTESATVLFIDLPGFSEWSQGMDPQAVLVTFNHLMGDFADVLARHEGRVVAYRGNGLMALVREARHADRAVLAALDLVSALEAFNGPRRLLGLPLFEVRIGIASGDVLLGNVGTYHKMDFTAIGPAVSMAGAIRNEARYGVPCVSRGTAEAVRGRFRFASSEPRSVAVAGFGAVEVWDVAGRA